MRSAVVGAGIMGASTAAALASRGHSVTLFEQFQVGHKRGSSHGNSRIVRKTYPDSFYAECAVKAYPLWAKLQAGTNLPILHECGLFFFGSEASISVRDAIDSLRQLGVNHEVMRAAQAPRLFPQLNLDSNEMGVFTAEAGWVHAGNAVKASVQRFLECGGTLIEERRIDRSKLEEFDSFVICAGSWITNFVQAPVNVSVQTFGYVRSGKPMGGPVWIEDGPELFYGFPSEVGMASFKVGVHRAGPTLSADDDERSPDIAEIAAIRQQALRRFGIEDARVEAQTCLYSTTETEDFLLGRVGEHGFFASPCSGHGFKFGPWIGELMADFIEGKDTPERHPRFCFQPSTLPG